MCNYMFYIFSESRMLYELLSHVVGENLNKLKIFFSSRAVNLVKLPLLHVMSRNAFEWTLRLIFFEN